MTVAEEMIAAERRRMYGTCTFEPPAEGEYKRTQDELPDETFSANLAPISAADLIIEHPEKRPAIIDGVIRRGETMNLIGAAKAGKTWFVHNMLLSIAAGREWFGMETNQGRVLLIDNELHPEELASRIGFVAERMGVPSDVLRDFVDVIPLRGHLRSVAQIAAQIEPYAERHYAMIALDAFYRALPEGISENDNAAMAQVYNTVDHFAASQNAAIVLNHHSSKGDQSNKSVTDVGSGAGSISRAVDAHLTIRPHEVEGCAVLDGVVRSWAPMQPLTIRWDYPLWTATHIEPALKQQVSARDIKQARRDKESDDKILSLLNSGPKEKGELRNSTGWGVDRLTRCLARLEDAGAIVHSRPKKPTGKTVDIYIATAPPELPKTASFV